MKSLPERFDQGQSMMNTAEMLEGEDNGTVIKDLGMRSCCAKVARKGERCGGGAVECESLRVERRIQF